MTNSNPASGNNPRLPTLAECQTDALVLQGLIQAFSEICTTNTKSALNARGALITVMEDLAGKLADNLDVVKL